MKVEPGSDIADPHGHGRTPSWCFPDVVLFLCTGQLLPADQYGVGACVVLAEPVRPPPGCHSLGNGDARGGDGNRNGGPEKGDSAGHAVDDGGHHRGEGRRDHGRDTRGDVRDDAAQYHQPPASLPAVASSFVVVTVVVDSVTVRVMVLLPSGL